MDQLTLEQAAIAHSNTYMLSYNQKEAMSSFKAGATWQQEQLKERLYTAADMEKAFAAGKNYGSIEVIFMPDFDEWIKNYHPERLQD